MKEIHTDMSMNGKQLHKAKETGRENIYLLNLLLPANLSEVQIR